MVHVVIVDDDEIIRGLVAQIISMLGWTSSSAATGVQALSVIQREKPDLVISDVGMPGMSGIELLTAIKSDPQTAHIPVVIISSIDRENEARAGGCAAFLAKPFTVDAMLRLLPQVVPSNDSP
jgi:CheY-like chemotaxis protein